jgi:hypothetical protein
MTNITERYDDRTTTDDQLAKLTPAVIDDLKAKGHTQSDIARMYGVTRQHVSWVKLTYGGRLTPREIVLREHWPWSVSEQQSQSSPYRRMRDHGEWFATGGHR